MKILPRHGTSSDKPEEVSFPALHLSGEKRISINQRSNKFRLRASLTGQSAYSILVTGELHPIVNGGGGGGGGFKNFPKVLAVNLFKKMFNT